MHFQSLENGHGEEMVNGLDEGWMRVSSIMDPGGAESEAPPTTCLHIPLTESHGSRAGQEYRTAGGERLRNKGQRHTQAWTGEGCPVGMHIKWRMSPSHLTRFRKCVVRETSLRSLLKTIKNVWTDAAMHFGRKSVVSVLNTWVKRGAPGGIDFARQAM